MENQILDELRKQTRDNRIGMTVMLVLLMGLIATIPFHQKIISHFTPARQVTDTWREARYLYSEEKRDEAVKMVQRLIQKYPYDSYGYVLLGCWQQGLGNLNEAEANFAKAYDLLPSEENGKYLTNVRKAMEKKKTSANQSIQPKSR
ncbi:MAG: hypothetical protein PHD76_15010 [Methylacidiphilales bacterium]|nr:hypothetical protein [Candidatus Methylacidiphilales bacterium]